MLLDAAGLDVVIIETVGVGQDEVEIARLAQVDQLVVMVPALGDDVQAMKAGIIEIADVFVINKADLPGAEKLEQELMAFQNLADGVGRRVAQSSVASRARPRGSPKCLHEPRTRLQARSRHLAALADRTGRRASIIWGSRSDRSTKRSSFIATNWAWKSSLRETVAQEKVNVAMLPLGEPRIELLEPTEPDSVDRQISGKARRGTASRRASVPDLDASVERLQASGARMLNEPRTGAGGHLYVFVHPSSTGGVLLELIQA